MLHMDKFVKATEARDRMPDPPAHSHEDSGMVCAGDPNDRQGNRQPQCINCKRCGEWIRPAAMGQECPGKQQSEATDAPHAV